MLRLQRQKIRLYVWLFSLLLLIFPFCIGLWVVFHLNSVGFQESLRAAVATPVASLLAQHLPSQPVGQVVLSVQLSLVALLLLLLSGHLLALYLLYRFLITPIQEMTALGRQIAEGSLEHTAPAYGCTEIDELGQCLNDISSTIQELVLLSWNHLRDSATLLTRANSNALLQGTEKSPLQLRQDLAAIEHEIHKMEQVITSFSLYDVQIDDRRALAGSQTIQEAAAPSLSTIATDGQQTRSLQ